MMISTYEAAPTLVEADAKRIDSDGLFRRMLETGHCPLKDYDIVALARAYGIGTGTMITLIKKRGLDARLEDENMGTPKGLDKDQMLELHNAGWSDYQIGKELGCTANAVSYWRRKNNLPANGIAIDKMPKPEPEPEPKKSPEEAPTFTMEPDLEEAAATAADEKIEVYRQDYDMIRDRIDYLERERLVMIGIAIGAGVFDEYLIRRVAEALV